ncbi:MAG TPA: tRNA lysidine(34) synthetase TilS [Cyclobacteriaceae bacterium]|nr:tRNA lysidine(34) synthetase TilS [Cyclobacteriaceae bacterium]
MRERFQKFIGKHDLCSRTQRVFVAVSGGIDSMVLLDLFVQSGYNITCAHVNFGLRGEESDEDERFVRDRCNHLGIPFLSKPVATKNYATGKGISIQMAARELRYQWFSELLNDSEGSVLATAHHINDSGETMLLNLIRGTGIDGLTGIPIKKDGIIRPLAFATRSEIDQYAAAHLITWREDESNLDDHYQRNFLRHRVMGLLKQLNPSLDDTLSRNSTRMGGERELIERSLAELKEDFVVDGDGTIRIDKSIFDGFIHKSGVLLRMIEPFGFNFATAESIVAAMNGQPGKSFFSTTHQLVVDRKYLIISALNELGETEISQGSKQVSLGNQTLQINESTNVEIPKDHSIASLDLKKITFPLTWRKWKEGDSFQPLGMKGRKKVSDFLIDEKISLTGKQTTTVLISGGEIIWVVGMRIDDRYKITPATNNVLVISLNKKP